MLCLDPGLGFPGADAGGLLPTGWRLSRHSAHLLWSFLHQAGLVPLLAFLKKPLFPLSLDSWCLLIVRFPELLERVALEQGSCPSGWWSDQTKPSSDMFTLGTVAITKGQFT